MQVALLVKETLDTLGLESFPKTSGADGIHVLVPISRRHTYEDTRQFAEIVAGALASTHRGLVTTEWSKSKRKGVLIDANQNGEGKTIASVYSVRPKEGASGLDAAALGGGRRVARPDRVHDGGRPPARGRARRPLRGRAHDEAVALGRFTPSALAATLRQFAVFGKGGAT